MAVLAAVLPQLPRPMDIMVARLPALAAAAAGVLQALARLLRAHPAALAGSTLSERKLRVPLRAQPVITVSLAAAAAALGLRVEMAVPGAAVSTTFCRQALPLAPAALAAAAQAPQTAVTLVGLAETAVFTGARAQVAAVAVQRATAVMAHRAQSL
jgi:hypothetical protein